MPPVNLSLSMTTSATTTTCRSASSAAIVTSSGTGRIITTVRICGRTTVIVITSIRICGGIHIVCCSVTVGSHRITAVVIGSMAITVDRIASIPSV